MIRLRVKSLSELRERHVAGDYVSGTVFSTPEGSFTISLYPTGDKLSNPGFIGVYLTCLSLKDPGIRGVRVGATWNLLSEDGVLVTSRHEKLTPILLTPDPGDDPQLGKGRGYTNFYRPSAELEAFTLTCDFVIREVVREDGSSSATSMKIGEDGAAGSEGGGESLTALLGSIRRLYEKEVDRGKRARVFSVEELRTLTLDQLLEMQDQVTTVIKEKRTEENECAVCQDRVKTVAFVPCGHRVCAECSPSLLTCPECRQQVTQKIRLF